MRQAVERYNITKNKLKAVQHITYRAKNYLYIRRKYFKRGKILGV